MKKFVAIALMLLIAISICAIASAEKFVVTTESDSLNIRLACDHDVILGGLKKGTILNADYTDKYWAYFTYDGQLCCAYKGYLTPAGDGSTPAPKTSKPGPKTSTIVTSRNISLNEASMIYVVSDDVNNCIHVRTRKDTKASSLGELYPGEEVYVIIHGGTWSRVVYEGNYGYVLSKCLEFRGYNLPEEGELYRVKVANGTTLNVRSESKKGDNIVRRLPNGAFVKMMEQYEEWSMIFYDPVNKGFVMNKFITPVEE